MNLMDGSARYMVFEDQQCTLLAMISSVPLLCPSIATTPNAMLVAQLWLEKGTLEDFVPHEAI